MDLNSTPLRRLVLIILALCLPCRLESQLGPLNDREHAPQARSQDELDGYLRIISETNPEEILRETSAFISQFPASELTGTAYQYQMHAFEQVGDYDAMLASGQKALLANPDNLNTLLTLAPAIANRASQDPKRNKELALAEDYANRALAGIEKVRPPHQTPLEKWELEKREMQCRAHEVLGVIALDRGLSLAAIHEFQAAVQLSPTPAGSQYFRLALAFASAGDRSKALMNLRRAVDLGPESVRQLAQEETRKLSKVEAPP